MSSEKVGKRYCLLTLCILHLRGNLAALPTNSTAFGAKFDPGLAGKSVLMCMTSSVGAPLVLSTPQVFILILSRVILHNIFTNAGKSRSKSSHAKAKAYTLEQ